MKKSFRWFLVGFVVLVTSIVTLAACHSSGGGGFFGFGGGGTPTGASTFSRGMVASQNNQQNVSVNGIQFGTGNSNIMINGNSGTSTDLRMGQIVTLRGNASGANGTASTVVFNNEMTGPITSVSAVAASNGTGVVSSATFTMFGQTVKVDGNTLFESDNVDITNLQSGSVVEVSGMPDGQGTLIATFINTQPTTTLYNVRGSVSNLSGSTFTLTPNTNGNPLTVTLGPGVTITKTGVTVSGATGGTGSGGTVTTVTGTSVSGTTSGGTGGTVTNVTGTSVSGTTSGGTGGTVTNVTGTSVSVTGTGAGAGGTSDGLANGQFVDVKIDPATYTPGSTSITARSVTIETNPLPAEGDTVFIEGFASNATGTNAGANFFRVDGITVNAGTNTVPPAGSRVAVHGTFRNGIVVADMVQPAAGSQLTIGSISSITGTAAAGAGGAVTTVTGTSVSGTTSGGTGGTVTNVTGTSVSVTSAGASAVQMVSCPASGTTNVTIRDFSFTPANVSIAANNIVKWTNNGPSQHTVTSTGASAFDSGTFAAGSSVCFQFPTAGTFNYHCSIHPFMTGSVSVTGTGTGGTTGTGAGGTGTVSGATGTVRMVVNGNVFDVSTAKIKLNGQPATIADLQPGKQVIVKAFSNNFTSVLFPGTTAATGGTAATSGTAAGAGAGGTSVTAPERAPASTSGTTAGTGGTTGTGAGTAAGTGTTATGTGTGGTGGTVTTVTGTSVSGTTSGGAGGTVTNVTGTSVSATSTGAGAGGTGTGFVAKAVTVWIIDNIEGPATAMSGSFVSISTGTTGAVATAATATFTVFGQTIVANNNTRFGSQLQSLRNSNTGGLAGLDTAGTNPVIDASGIPDNSGDLLATFLESSPTATEYHVRGIVSSATGSPLSTFTLTPVPNGPTLTVSVASSATITNVIDGMTVNVRIDPSTFNSGSTTITAKAVDPVKEPIPAENDLVSVEGIVAGNGTIMTATGPLTLASGSTTNLSPGTRVIVRGTVSNGTLTVNQAVVQ